MKFDYSQVTQALRQEAKTQAEVQPLRNDRCHSLFYFHARPTQKVFLLFHGFTAAPYQFGDVAQALFKDGHNVVVPLLPGHGLLGHWGPEMPPPLPQHRRIYEEFALRWLKRSRVLGQHLVLGGVSVGATLATWLGVQYPKQVERLLLLDPYLPNTQDSLHLFTETQGDYVRWIVPQHQDYQNALPGYGGFSHQALAIWLELAQDTQTRSQVSPLPPVLLVGSERERALNQEVSRLFCEQIRQYQPKAWHLYFTRALDLAHGLLTNSHNLTEDVQLTHLIQTYAQLELAAS